MPSPPVWVIKGSSAHETREVHVLCRGPKEMNLVGHHYEGKQQAEGAKRNPRYQDCSGCEFSQGVLRMLPESNLHCGATESRQTIQPGAIHA
jgi:hypothetical protein